MTSVPDRPEKDRAPARRLSNEEFELVIRRAAELQAHSAEERDGEGVSEEDVIRIGRELGLTGAHLGRALAEVRGGEAAEHGLMVKVMGPARFGASRAVRGEPAALARILERHLVDQQYLAVQRRLQDRTLFVRASGVMAAMARTTSEVFGRGPILKVENLEVSVRRLEPGYSFVGLSTDLAGERMGHAVGGAALGGTVGGAGGLALGLIVAPVAAAVALPILVASVGGLRYAYQSTARKVLVQLEALLDRLEHGELGTGS